MDPTKILEADHRQAEDLLKRIKDAEGDERASLIDELAAALLAHMELEERILYPAIKDVLGDESLEEAEAEHRLAREALNDVVAMAGDAPGIGAAVDTLEAAISHHVEDEESDVFPDLREKAASRLEELRTPFMQKRMELDMETSARTLEASFSKPELVDEAEKAGIEGASSMNKEDIAEALARRIAS